MATTTPPTNTDFLLNIKENYLHIGEMTVPIRTANSCWLNNTRNWIQIDCHSWKGLEYKAMVTLSLQSEEKVKQCMQLLLEKTYTKICPPHIKSIQPNPGMINFEFANAKDAQQFQYYYCSYFFPEKEYEYKLDRTRCQVICRTQNDPTNQIARINQALAHLDSRMHGHLIHERLYKNADPQFPGKTYPKRKPVSYSLDVFNRDRHRGFAVKPDGIFEIDWPCIGLSSQHERREVPSQCAELNEWINQPRRPLGDTIQDKMNWENLYQEICKSSNPAFAAHVQKLKLLLEKFDCLSKDQLMRQIDPFLQLIESGNTEAQILYFKCFS